MKPTGLVTSLWVGLLVALGACGDDSTGGDPSDVKFELTIVGDASFQGPHGGDVLTRVTRRTGAPADEYQRSIGAILSPSVGTIGFSGRTSVRLGEAYQIYLWIDSNIGGGTVGFVTPRQ